MGGLGMAQMPPPGMGAAVKLRSGHDVSMLYTESLDEIVMFKLSSHVFTNIEAGIGNFETPLFEGWLGWSLQWR